MVRKGRTWRKRYSTKERLFKNLALDNDIISLSIWMQSRGFRNKSLVPAVFQNTGRGIMARKRITDIIIQVPEGLIITTRTILKSGLGPFFRKKARQFSSLEALCLFLIYERSLGDESIWHFYIRTLPEEYSIPTYWTEEELDILPKSLRSKVNTEVKQVQRLYERCLRLGGNLSTFLRADLTWNDFKWAWSAINTRCIYMKTYSGDYFLDDTNHLALIPYLDLLNHSDSAMIEAGFNKDKNCYEIKTLKTYNKYDQVFISYGSHANAKLLLEYGFVIPSIQFDAVEFDFNFIKGMFDIDDELFERLTREGFNELVPVIKRIS
ncbi:DgyrCDS8342 [Dimorphilus gyrociliatus]|uniref:DgyrCDS8342 n=1 Tax=Dimorphilus gyrociliatus TaxID=2664684 RepID=A0A7I8VTV8_9ANNE|nr:DgyrCDS8342 [Dimorphilus gyrociliatus]